MVKSKLIGLLFESWKDFDRVMMGVTPQEALARPDGESSFAWTLAHVTNHVDRWINVIAQDMLPHPDIGKQEFRFGGSGTADDWEAIRLAAQEVRAAAREYLNNITDSDLESVVLEDNDPKTLPDRKRIKLYSVLLRITSHYYFHIGEIAAKRDRMGHSVGDYPGPLDETL